MGRIYAKINGSWTIRNTVRNQVCKTLDSIISAGVGPAWKAMSQTVESLRPQIEPKIKELVDPIGKAEGEMMQKIQDAAMSVINPLLEQHVNPHLAKIMEVIQSPMTGCYDESYKMFDEQINKFEVKAPKDELMKGFRQLDWFHRSWEMYNATRGLDILYDPLWALNIIFPDIYPWGLIWRGHDEIRRTMDNAMYTFEQKLLKECETNEGALNDGKSLAERFKCETLEDYKYDGKLRTVEWYCEVIKKIIYPPFNAVVIPACKALLDPINELIPEPLKQFLDINQMFDDLINGIIDESIKTVVSSGQK